MFVAKSQNLFFILILTFGFFSIPVNSGKVSVKNNVQTVSLSITNAYYADVNNDGYEDDVVILFDINIDRQSRSQFDIYFGLTLPLGRVVTYGYWINTSLKQLRGIMIFYNDATESGYYQIDIELILYSGGITSGHASYVFDPPGETSGGDPQGSLTLM